MDNRKYNIYFHTHTISGIVICAILYVIFFAGSFSFFREEISAWQKNTTQIQGQDGVKDFDHLMDSLSTRYNLRGRNFDFYLSRNDQGAYVSMTASNDTTLIKKPENSNLTAEKNGKKGRKMEHEDSANFVYDFAKQRASDYDQSYDMGEFLYRLHFLAQLNAVPIHLGRPFGYLLAGVVSFLFLFALITGLMLHWNKISSNFFTFRPWSKWKTLWTDLHTAIGVIGFPFQLVYAITGLVLIANAVLTGPYTTYLYKGNSTALYHDLEYDDSTSYVYSYRPLQEQISLNDLFKKVESRWPASKIGSMQVKNFGDANMHVLVQAQPNPNVSFSGIGKLVYRVRDQKVIKEIRPADEATYVGKVQKLIYHLHFGDFGGRSLKILFFVLGIMACIVIISGILIWLVVRDKVKVPQKKRVFNFWTANIFMAICLSMLPVTAFTLSALLFVAAPTKTDIYHLFFYSWLVLSIYFTSRRSLSLTNHQTLILSVLFCLSVPLLDGIKRGNWLWHTFHQQSYNILFVDLLFLCLAILSLVVLVKMKQHERSKNYKTPEIQHNSMSSTSIYERTMDEKL